MATPQYPTYANFIRVATSTASILSKSKAKGIAFVGGKLYVNTTGTVGLFADIAMSSALNIGAKNGATVSAVETGFGGTTHKTVLTLTATPITMRDTEQGGGVKIYDFPLGAITIVGASGSIAVITTSILANTLNTGVTCNWGVGTTTQASATLATTEQDILTVSAFTASATINVAGATATKGRTAAPANFDGTATAIDAFLNLAVAGATDIDADATVTVTGTITISWLFNS